MSSAASSLVNKVWNYCNLLRDDGVPTATTSSSSPIFSSSKWIMSGPARRTTRSPLSPKITTGPASSKWTAFVRYYNPKNRHQRSETERFRCFSYEDLIKRDKANLDIFWLRDDSLGDSSDLPDPAVLAAEIVEDLQAALDQFAQIAADLGVTERDAGTG